jgi:hypothetical protein
LDEKKKGEYINMIMKESGKPVPVKCPEKHVKLPKVRASS